MNVAEALGEFLTILSIRAHQLPVTLTQTLHLDLLLVWAAFICMWLIGFFHTDFSFRECLLELHLLLALPHDHVRDSTANDRN